MLVPSLRKTRGSSTRSWREQIVIENGQNTNGVVEKRNKKTPRKSEKKKTQKSWKKGVGKVKSIQKWIELQWYRGREETYLVDDEKGSAK